MGERNLVSVIDLVMLVGVLHSHNTGNRDMSLLLGGQSYKLWHPLEAVS